MAINYHVVARPLPMDRKTIKYYAQPRVMNRIDHKQLCASAAIGRSVIPAELTAAVETMVIRMRERLSAGDSVYIEGLGTFRMSLSCTGADSPESFHDGLIRKKRILFRPSVEMLEMCEKTGIRRMSQMACNNVEDEGGPGQGE